MLERSQHSFTDLIQKQIECGVSRKIGSQNQRIDEVAHYFGQPSSTSAGGRRPYQNDILPAVAMQQDLKGCKQSCVKRGVVCLGQSLELVR